jgi:hypothetical protein
MHFPDGGRLARGSRLIVFDVLTRLCWCCSWQRFTFNTQGKAVRPGFEKLKKPLQTAAIVFV